MSHHMLSLEGLSIAFAGDHGTVPVVEDVSFALDAGRSLGLVGESGSGKTMVGLALMRLVPAPGRITAGSIRLDGTDLMSLDEAAMRRVRGAGIAMVLQDPMNSLNPTLTVATQMIEAIEAHHAVSRNVARERAREALGRVGIADPDARLDAYPHQFSGGMRQRVAIATAMINRPKVLIADEPTTALDVTIQAQILAEVRKLCREQGTALVWISHDLAVVTGLVEQVCVMYAGEIVEKGPIAEVIEAPRHPYTRGLIASIPELTPAGVRLPQISGMAPAPTAWPRGCRFAPRCFQAAPACAQPPALAEQEGAAQRAVRCHYPLASGMPRRPAAEAPAVATSATGAMPLIAVEDVCKVFRRKSSWFSRRGGRGGDPDAGSVRAVDHVSLAVRSGEVLGIVGESGSGKSTLARILAGMMPPDSGSVQRNLRRGSGRLDVQLIFQDAMASLNPRQWVGHAIAEAPLLHGLWQRHEVQERLRDLLVKVGIDPGYATRYPHQFSGGQRQRIAIARALAVEPQVLICDEAVASLDVSIQAQILNLLADLRETFALTYVFIGHDLGVVRHVSDRVAVMYLGRIVEEGPVSALFHRPRHPYTQALLAGAPTISGRAVATADDASVGAGLSAPRQGCGYAPRCGRAEERCRRDVPALAGDGPEVRVACFHPGASR